MAEWIADPDVDEVVVVVSDDVTGDDANERGRRPVKLLLRDHVDGVGRRATL